MGWLVHRHYAIFFLVGSTSLTRCTLIRRLIDSPGRRRGMSTFPLSPHTRLVLSREPTQNIFYTRPMFSDVYGCVSVLYCRIVLQILPRAQPKRAENGLAVVRPFAGAALSLHFRPSLSMQYRACAHARARGNTATNPQPVNAPIACGRNAITECIETETITNVLLRRVCMALPRATSLPSDSQLRHSHSHEIQASIFLYCILSS